MSFKKLFLLNIFVVFRAISAQNYGYRFKLDIGNPDILCPSPNYKCSNGKVHYLCKPTTIKEAVQKCDYEDFSFTQKFKRTLLEGTNGIRNKVAMNLGISNMNIVYWSNELSKMASEFTKECIKGADPCLILGENQIKVNENHVTISTIHDRLAGSIVRHWFKELGTDVRNWRDFKKKHARGKMNSLTKMIYPLVEFIGCGGAKMYGGYFVLCYYHPPFNRSEFPSNFQNGYPCTNCSESRTTCSKTFTSLCGLDVDMAGASYPKLHFSLLLICILLFFYIDFHYRKEL